MTPRRRATIVTLAAACAALLAHGTPGSANAAEPIRIGWLSSLTGALSSSALAENEGVKFAIGEVNARGGVLGRPLELITRDTASEPTKAVNLAQQLIFRDKVDFVIGPVNSGESLATVPIVAKAGIPNLVIGTVDALIDPAKYPLAFRVINTNEQWINAANEYVVRALGLKKVAVIGDTSGYGTASAKAAADLLGKLGVQPVYSALIDPNKTDVSDEMGKARRRVRRSSCPGRPQPASRRGCSTRAARWLGRAGGGPPGDDGAAGQAAAEQAGLLGERLRLRLPQHDLPARRHAAAAHPGADGRDPPSLGGKIDLTFWWVALGYDCVRIIEHGVTKAGSTKGEAFAKALEETSGLEGVYATYSWGPGRHNGFPDGDMVIELANSLREGSWEPAPKQ